MVDHSSISSVVPAVVASALFSTWYQKRRRKRLEDAVRQAIQTRYPALQWVSIDARKIVVRCYGQECSLILAPLTKEFSKKNSQFDMALEQEIVRATGRTVDELITPAPDVANASADELQFDHAEKAGTRRVAARCALCGKDFKESYFEVNDKTACETCKTALFKMFKDGSDWKHFLPALVFGLGSAVLGCLLYYGITTATGYEFGLIAVVVGFMVGGSVRKGSRGRGGWVYQTLAIALTYAAIVFTYSPSILNTLRVHSAAGSIVILFIILAFPFISGIKNVMGLFIIAIALYEAWKLNKRPAVRISGPFHLATENPPPTAE
jgi:hypothetical protein